MRCTHTRTFSTVFFLVSSISKRDNKLQINGYGIEEGDEQKKIVKNHLRVELFLWLFLLAVCVIIVNFCRCCFLLLLRIVFNLFANYCCCRLFLENAADNSVFVWPMRVWSKHAWTQAAVLLSWKSTKQTVKTVSPSFSKWYGDPEMMFSPNRLSIFDTTMFVKSSWPAAVKNKVLFTPSLWIDLSLVGWKPTVTWLNCSPAPCAVKDLFSKSALVMWISNST